MINTSYQTTLRRSTQAKGIGLHSGIEVTMEIQPACANTGIVFVRTDLPKRPELRVNPQTIVDAMQCTCLASGDIKISTVEHLMAALFALGVDNAVVALDGEEVPIFDGSALAFVNLIQHCGIRLLSSPRLGFHVLKTIKIVHQDRWIKISPARSLSIDCTVHFDHPLIAKQRLRYFHRDKGEFQRSIAPARTFGFLEEVEKLHHANLARGGSLQNAVVISNDRILNPDGLRFSDEFVRHKLLDIVGDFALLGSTSLAASITAYKPGHRLHGMLIQKLIQDPEAWTWKAEEYDQKTIELPIFRPEPRTPNLQRV